MNNPYDTFSYYITDYSRGSPAKQQPLDIPVYETHGGLDPQADVFTAGNSSGNNNGHSRYKEGDNHDHHDHDHHLESRDNGWPPDLPRQRSDTSPVHKRARSEHARDVGDCQSNTIDWDSDDIDALVALLDKGEKIKWKYISGELYRSRGKRLTVTACQDKFREMFGVVEFASLLGSSLPYVAYPNGWDCLPDSV